MNAHTKNLISKIILYVTGLFAVFIGLGYLMDSASVPFLVIMVAACIQLPFTYKIISEKLKVELRAWHRLLTGTILLVISFIIFNPGAHLTTEISKDSQVSAPQPFLALDTTTLLPDTSTHVYAHDYNAETVELIKQTAHIQEKPVLKKKPAPVQKFVSIYKPKEVKRIQTHSSYNSSTGSHECYAITRKGTRCRRMVVNGYNCWQHGG